MKTLLVLSLLCASVAVVYSFMGIHYQNGTECVVYGEIKLKPGNVYNDRDGCMLYKCEKLTHDKSEELASEKRRRGTHTDRHDLVLDIEGCGVMAVGYHDEEEAKILRKQFKAQLKQPYPKCCQPRFFPYPNYKNKKPKRSSTN